MTPNLLDELEGVVPLLAATTGDSWQVAPRTANNKVTIMSGCARVANISVTNLDWRQNAQLITDSVNFLRTHHAEIADMAKRMEAAERDAALVKLEAERDFLHDWLQYAFYPVGMDCCGRGQGGDCCGDGVPVYATLPDVQQAMNKRLGEIEDAIAAIDATQEGEG